MLETIFSWLTDVVGEALTWVVSAFLGVLDLSLDKFLVIFPVLPTAYTIFQAISIGLIILIAGISIMGFFLPGLTKPKDTPAAILIKAGIAGMFVYFGMYLVEWFVDLAKIPYDTFLSVLKAESFDADSVSFGEAFTNGITATGGTEGAAVSIGAGAVTFICFILLLIVAWNILKLMLEVVERYLMVGFLAYTSPLIYSTMASSETSHIFRRWLSMFFGQCLLMFLSVFSFDMILSGFVFTTKASESLADGSAPFWLRIIVILAMCKIAQRLDSYLQQIGIGAATTGQNLWDDIVATAMTFGRMGRMAGGGGGGRGGSDPATEASGKDGSVLGGRGRLNNGTAPSRFGGVLGATSNWARQAVNRYSNGESLGTAMFDSNAAKAAALGFGGNLAGKIAGVRSAHKFNAGKQALSDYAKKDMRSNLSSAEQQNDSHMAYGNKNGQADRQSASAVGQFQIKDTPQVGTGGAILGAKKDQDDPNRPGQPGAGNAGAGPAAGAAAAGAAAAGAAAGAVKIGNEKVAGTAAGAGAAAAAGARAAAGAGTAAGAAGAGAAGAAAGGNPRPDFNNGQPGQDFGQPNGMPDERGSIAFDEAGNAVDGEGAVMGFNDPGNAAFDANGEPIDGSQNANGEPIEGTQDARESGSMTVDNSDRSSQGDVNVDANMPGANNHGANWSGETGAGPRFDAGPNVGAGLGAAAGAAAGAASSFDAGSNAGAGFGGAAAAAAGAGAGAAAASAGYAADRKIDYATIGNTGKSISVGEQGKAAGIEMRQSSSGQVYFASSRNDPGALSAYVAESMSGIRSIQDPEVQRAAYDTLRNTMEHNPSIASEALLMGNADKNIVASSRMSEGDSNLGFQSGDRGSDAVMASALRTTFGDQLAGYDDIRNVNKQTSLDSDNGFRGQYISFNSGQGESLKTTEIVDQAGYEAMKAEGKFTSKSDPYTEIRTTNGRVAYMREYDGDVDFRSPGVVKDNGFQVGASDKGNVNASSWVTRQGVTAGGRKLEVDSKGKVQEVKSFRSSGGSDYSKYHDEILEEHMTPPSKDKNKSKTKTPPSSKGSRRNKNKR